MSGSTDPDGTIIGYFMNCGGGTFTSGSPSSHGSCFFDTPGTYWLSLEAEDNSFNIDVLSAYVVVTPPASSDTTPPSVSMTSPAPGSTVAGVVTVSASASDAGSGVQKVDFYRDSGVLIGSATASPYSISWDTSTAAAGTHTLYAVATDNAGNSATSASITITVAAATGSAPVVSITSPANNSTVARRSTVTIKASMATSSPISHVDFVVNSSVICSSTVYTCNWAVPIPANKTYQIQVKAFDAAGKEGDSSILTVTAR